MNAERLVEDIQLRSKYIDNVDVLDKVKTLSLLPDDEYMTTKMVADYYEVEKITIDLLTKRHKEELVSDGVNMIEGQELRVYKSTHLRGVSELKRVPKLTLYNRRAILRVGMLLRDSEVAKQVRTYLLDIEQQSTRQQKSESTKGSSWDGKEVILYDIIISEINNGGTLTSACEKASKRIGKSKAACMARYTHKIKPTIKNTELIKKVESNKSMGRKKNGYDSKDVVKYIEKINNGFIEMLQEKVETLESDLDKSKKINLKLKKELQQYKAIIASSIDLKVNDEIKNTFKMDWNGNLNRI